MFIQTHWSIGEAMIKNISELLPFPFEKIPFQYGCIAPDFIKSMPDHTKARSIHYIAGLLREVQQHEFNTAREGNRDCYYKMGIIIHYIADYFCRPHNDDPRYERLLSHILYENRLHFACSAADLLQMSHTGLERCYDLLDPHNLSLLEYINEKHIAYLAEPPNIKRDLAYAAETGMTIITALLWPYLIKPKRMAA